MRQIADAVLYEGYILWPYGRSALKNRLRWTFGGVYPRAHSEGRDDDPWQMQTECLLEAGERTRLGVSVRFLHVVRRQLLRHGPEGPEPVDELVVGADRHLSWEEATEREFEVRDLDPALLAAAPRRIPVRVSEGNEQEELRDARGRAGGTANRSWRELEGWIEVSAERLEKGLFRVTVRIANTSPWRGGDRGSALEQTFCSTHTVIHAAAGALVSATDPPPALRAAAESCRNMGAWPVLVGEPGERHTLLSSPIILEDYPRVAPESPGDLFDGGEIDGLLTLNILSLTDSEKEEMRASDPRAREILERTEALTPEELMRLHGTIREFRHARP